MFLNFDVLLVLGYMCEWSLIYTINKKIPCFVFNFWRTKISSYKFWNNILFSLIFFPTKNKKRLKQ